MKLIIDIPETQYNNIMEVKSMSLGRIPYKGIIMNAIRGIQNGTPIPDNAAVCDIEQIRAEIENMRNKVKPLDDFSDRGMYADGKIAAYDYVLQIIDNYTKGAEE